MCLVLLWRKLILIIKIVPATIFTRCLEIDFFYCLVLPEASCKKTVESEYIKKCRDRKETEVSCARDKS